MMFSRLVVGGISAVMWLVTFAAIDDITTGNEPALRLEYGFLIVSACWFAFVTVWLFRVGMWFPGLLSGGALLATVFGRGAIRPGVVPGLRPEYVAFVVAFLSLGVLATIPFLWRGVGGVRS